MSGHIAWLKTTVDPLTLWRPDSRSRSCWAGCRGRSFLPASLGFPGCQCLWTRGQVAPVSASASTWLCVLQEHWRWVMAHPRNHDLKNLPVTTARPLVSGEATVVGSGDLGVLISWALTIQLRDALKPHWLHGDNCSQTHDVQECPEAKCQMSFSSFILSCTFKPEVSLMGDISLGPLGDVWGHLWRHLGTSVSRLGVLLAASGGATGAAQDSTE